MVDLSENVKWGYANEAAYAAGAGTTEYEQTALASASAMDYPADSFTLPLTTYGREVLTGYNLNSSVTYTKGVEYADSSFKMYVQTSTWLAYALNGGSFALYYNTPSLGVRTAFGCMIKKYTFEAKGDDFPMQSMDLIYYSVSGQTALASEPTPLTSTPLTHKDVTISFDGGTAICASSIVFTIDNEVLDEIAVGAYGRCKSVIKSRKYTLEVEAYDGLSSLLDDPDSLSVPTHTVSIAGGTLFTLNGIDVVVTKATREEIPGQRDAFKYKITMEGGSWSI